MLSLGPIAFAAPAALIGLLILPIVWRLLRASPPQPQRRLFPPLRLLDGLAANEETQERTPWWLLAIRLTALAMACFGLARPVLNPAPPPEGDGPLVLIVDNGWASAADWPRTMRAAEARIDAAARSGRPVAVVLTAAAGEHDITLEEPAAARRRLAAARAEPWGPDRAKAAEAIGQARADGALPSDTTPEWVSDGLDHGEAMTLAREMTNLKRGRITTPGAARAPLALSPPTPTAEGFEIVVQRATTGGPRTGAILALDTQGRALGRTGFAFELNDDIAMASMALPLEVRNRVALVRVEGAASAGAAQVLDDRWRRPSVGLVASAGERDRQPLLADLHYVEKALAPFAETRRAPLSDLLDEPPAIIVLTDAGRVVGDDQDDLERFVENGGVLLRFAGPRLAARSDALSPVRLRAGGRALGGALAWEEPRELAPFSDDSPFVGLTIDTEVTIEQQVLTEPAPDLADKTWARLADGTPLVTADRRGRGRIVLFHVTASPEWSNLPLSGLFVDMLRRVSAYADTAGAPEAASVTGPWRLETALDADGRLGAPPPDASPLDADSFDKTSASPSTPPGRWRRGAASQALNVLGEEDVLTPLPSPPAGVALETSDGAQPLPLGGPLLGTVLALLVLDAIAVFLLAGGLSRLAPNRVAAMLGALALCGALGASLVATQPAFAQAGNEADDEFLLHTLNKLRLAYVITGDDEQDELSRAGLKGLSDQLYRRTSIEPGEPVGVNIESDPIALLPMLYWPITRDQEPPSEEGAARLDQFLKSGGVLIFDTGDAASAGAYGAAPHSGLQRVIDAVDIPPLAPVGDGHVLTKAFYLLSDFPGRWRDAPMWVEADQRGSARDGVSSVIVTSADWAAAWAVDSAGRPMAAVSPGGERQREMAYRTGINLTMYILTGNYKADQVHVPQILERLGQ